ncbi:replication-associated recombination protein A [Patescibacteria group bacterium]|nr:replication-associated recombination protein A [Patescibacteria group bacterium]
MKPLAFLIRPKNLDEFIGQDHLVGKGKPLRVAIEQKHLFSFILWGPPGVGKTTLGQIYAESFDSIYHQLSAVSAGKDDIRKIVTEAPKINKPTIIFLDEIHRFNKAQQDFLLPYVENGTIFLIGATTENPSFEVISPLLSRCRVFTLEELTDKQMEKIIDRAKIKMSKSAKDFLIKMANGDARQALTVLENADNIYGKITVETLKETIQNKFLRYDKKGEEHYNTISAFIKSMRASDVNAALYYLARMIDSGEDPKFIARRMVVFASEDIGIANNTALLVANEVFEAVTKVGMPEAQISLAHGVTYLCSAKKDRSSYDAYFKAMEDVKKHGNLPIPLNIRNAPTKLMKDLGYGKGYKKYTKESLLPDDIKGKEYFSSS